jgi:hypothetical protein
MTTDGVWFEKATYNHMSNTSNSNATLFLNQNGTGAMQEWRLGGDVKGTFNQYGLGVGTAVPSSGAGITFPATQSASSDANTLDDYEEGTWTPTDSSGANLTFSNTSNNCFYTKIGNTVQVAGRIVFPSTASGSTVEIGGLPFSVKSTTSGVFGGYITFTTETTAATVWASTGTSVINFYRFGGGAVTNANLSGDDIRFVLIYQV